MKVDSIIEAVRQLQNDLITTQFALNNLIKVLERFNDRRDNTETVIKISPDSKMIEIPLSKKTGKTVGRRGRPRSMNSEVDMKAVENGAKGGLANAGVPKTKTVHRPKGSVGIKNMTIEQKREYWRWAAARKAERKAGETSK